MSWLFYAVLSAIASALTAILAKVGVEHVPSTLAVVYRTAVVLALTVVVASTSGQLRGLTALSRRSMVFLTLSGLMTGVAWLAYFRALQLGPASRVMPRCAAYGPQLLSKPTLLPARVAVPAVCYTAEFDTWPKAASALFGRQAARNA